MSPDIIGTIPQWLTGGAVTAFIVMMFRDSANLRGHYAKELDRLQTTIDGLREKLNTHERAAEDMEARYTKRWRDCEEESAELRAEVAGLKRQIAKYSADQLTILEQIGCPRTAAPHASASANRVRKITGEGK